MDPKAFADEYAAAIRVADLTLKEYAAIGRIAYESAYLERAIEILICNLVGRRPEIVKCLMRGAQLDAKLTIANQLLELKLGNKPRKLKQAKDLIAEIKRNIADRNTAIHGLWSTGLWSTSLALLLNAASEPKPRRPKATMHTRSGNRKAELSIEQANALADKILDSKARFLTLVYRTIGLPGLRAHRDKIRRARRKVAT